MVAGDGGGAAILNSQCVVRSERALEASINSSDGDSISSD